MNKMAQRKLVNEIIMMIRQNFTSSDILKQLREEGFNPAEIREGIDQAQTDSVTASLTAYAVQQRNNENFSCANVQLPN